MARSDPPAQLGVVEKLKLMGRIWWLYGRVVHMSRRQLPEQVELLKSTSVHRSRAIPPSRLGRAIHRGLRVGNLTPRCLPKALIMFRLLLEQGDSPVLVIGLPLNPRSHIAHAWVELDGRDVGPPPGRGGHDQLVRYE